MRQLALIVNTLAILAALALYLYALNVVLKPLEYVLQLVK